MILCAILYANVCTNTLDASRHILEVCISYQ
jgi:hypothetical protein